MESNERDDVKAMGKIKSSYQLFEVKPAINHQNTNTKRFLQSLFSIKTESLTQKGGVSYDIYANKQRVSYYFGCEGKYGKYLEEKLKYAFKGSTVSQIKQQDQSENDLSSTILYSYLLQSGADYSNKQGRQNNDYDDLVLTFRLKDHSFLPIQTKEQMRWFDECIHTFEQLHEKEEVWMQFLFIPLHEDWHDIVYEDYQKWLEGENIISLHHFKQTTRAVLRGVTNTIEDMARLTLNQTKEKRKRSDHADIKKKLTQPVYEVAIRVRIRAHHKRVSAIEHQIASLFLPFTHLNAWEKKKPIQQQMYKKQMIERKALSFSRLPICSMDELVPFVELPDQKIESTKICRTAPEEMAVDERLIKKGIHIGETIHPPTRSVYYSLNHPDDIARTRLIIAPPGSGKTTMIKKFVQEAMKHGHGCAIFDVADGDLYEGIIEVCSDQPNKVITIDYTDNNYPPAFNFSALGNDDETRGLMFYEFFEQLFKTEDLMRTQSYLLKTALSVFHFKENTLLEFLEMLRNPEFRQEQIWRLREIKPDLFLWWTREFPKIGEEKFQLLIAPIVVRLEILLYNPRMRNILCQKGGRMNPRQWMDEGKIVVFNLSGGSFTEPEQRIIMSLHNAMFWNATLAREELTRYKKKTRPFHLIYDEPQTYLTTTPMFDRAISKARKYGVSCHFYIQDPEQIIKESSALWKKMIGMNPHLLIGPVSEVSAKLLAKEMNVEIDSLLSVKKHPYCWYVRLFADKQATNAFIMKSTPPSPPRTNHSALIKQTSRQQYNTLPRYELEKDIHARLMGMTKEQYEKAMQLSPKKQEIGIFDWSDDEDEKKKKKRRKTRD